MIDTEQMISAEEDARLAAEQEAKSDIQVLNEAVEQLTVAFMRLSQEVAALRAEVDTLCPRLS